MKKRLVVGFVGATFLLILVISSNEDIMEKVVPYLGNTQDRDISCYEESSLVDGIVQLESYQQGSDESVPTKSIFFHETSCFGEEGAVLNARQACAVESAAKMNPKMTVYLLFVSPVKFSSSSKALVKQLTSYDNIKIRRIVMERYTKGTPLEEWWQTDILKTSRWPTSHMSDILRYLTLWKYGGIYLDLDVVVISNLENLTNFAGAEDGEAVAAGVMGFGTTGLGRRMADACLRDLKINFRGNVWGNNGPGVITRTLQKLCATKNVRNMTKIRCNGFTVHPPSAFYPIHYKKWTRYFEIKDKNDTMKIIEKARVIHVWNKLSKKRNITVGSQVPYGIIAQRHCPKVYSNCGTIF